jgi:hypothetical protein
MGRRAGQYLGFVVGGLVPSIVVFVLLSRPVGELPTEGVLGEVVLAAGGAHGFAPCCLSPFVFIFGGLLGAVIGSMLGGRAEKRRNQRDHDSIPHE